MVLETYTLWTRLSSSQPWAKRSIESTGRWKVVEQVLDKNMTEREKALDKETGAAEVEDNDEEEENVCAGLLNILLHCKLLQRQETGFSVKSPNDRIKIIATRHYDS